MAGGQGGGGRTRSENTGARCLRLAVRAADPLCPRVALLPRRPERGDAALMLHCG